MGGGSRIIVTGNNTVFNASATTIAACRDMWDRIQLSLYHNPQPFHHAASPPGQGLPLFTLAMKKKLLLLTAVCIALGAKAQDKYDYQWFLGYAALDIAKKYGTTVLDFHQSPVQLYTDKLRNNRTRTTAQICDKNGKMQFVSNGCKMINAQSQLIENGDSLNYPGTEWDRSCQWEYRTFPGMVALPYPGRDNYYCVFHYRYDWQGAFSPSVYTPESLLCTEIDMSANAGAGRVTRKNIPLQKDTFADNFAAVRHGNGRDWWVASFRSSPDKDRMFLYLLTPEGVKGPFERRTGLTWYIAPPFYSLSSAVFSPSGNRYARVHWGNDLQLFRFDRCAGTFGEAQRIRFPGDTISPGGVAFSPNGRFVYVSARERLYQVDCEAPPPAERTFDRHLRRVQKLLQFGDKLLPDAACARWKNLYDRHQRRRLPACHPQPQRQGGRVQFSATRAGTAHTQRSVFPHRPQLLPIRPARQSLRHFGHQRDGGPVP